MQQFRRSENPLTDDIIDLDRLRLPCIGCRLHFRRHFRFATEEAGKCQAAQSKNVNDLILRLVPHAGFRIMLTGSDASNRLVPMIAVSIELIDLCRTPLNQILQVWPEATSASIEAIGRMNSTVGWDQSPVR